MSPSFRNYALRKVSLLLFALLLTSCIQKPAVCVGFTAELSGKEGDLGVHLRNGVQLAVDEINRTGGINGRKIELLVENDYGTPEGAQAAENKLIDAGALVVIGHFTSGQTVAGYAVAEQREVPLLSATASTAELSGIKDLFFRTVVSTDTMGQVFARHIYQTRGIARVAIICDQDNNSYSEPMSRIFAETFTGLGGEVVDKITFFETDTPDFSLLAEKLSVANPDGILIIASPSSAALIAQNIRLKNWDVPLFSSSWAQGETLIRNGGKSVEGMEIIIGYDINDPATKLQAFKNTYQTYFSNTPAFTAMEGYETMWILATALQETNGEQKGLAEALAAMDEYLGLTGPIYMDEHGDALRPLYIQKVNAQRFVTVERIDLAPEVR